MPKFFTEMLPKEFFLSESEFSLVMYHHSNSLAQFFRYDFYNLMFVVPFVVVVVMPGISDCKE